MQGTLAMNRLKPFFVILALVAFIAVPLSACSPEVGSKEWCEQMKKKPKGDWSVNEAADFAKSCVL